MSRIFLPSAALCRGDRQLRADRPGPRDAGQLQQPGLQGGHQVRLLPEI